MGFVSTPDGTVISATGPTISSTGQTENFSVTITVPDAVLGTYDVGFVFPAGLELASAGATGTVVSSRDPTNITNLIIPVLDTGFPGEYQAQQGFIYGTTSGPEFP